MADVMQSLLDIAFLDSDGLPEHSRRLAGFSLADWMSVMLAASGSPIAEKIQGLIQEEAGAEIASVTGFERRYPTRAAALANGTISHVLDYDDTHFAHIGHLSVGIYPAALAVGEECNALASAVRDAFLVGAEAACRLGVALGPQHYDRGFHQTATAGAFGATVAAGRLYGLDRDQMRNALSLVATRASGLKSQFGTMGKPFNAGISASNGVEAIKLARLGFTSCADGIGGPQGFIATHADAPQLDRAFSDMPPKRFVFDDISYKLHACCHGTHAMIEALLRAKRQSKFDADIVEAVTIETSPRWLSVCDIKTPRTGLEAKFSYGLLAAMVLNGISTASEAVYTDALCANPTLTDVASRVSVMGNATIADAATRVTVTLRDGRKLTNVHDLAAKRALDDLQESLVEKSRMLIGADKATQLWSMVAEIERCSARDFGSLLRGA